MTVRGLFRGRREG